MSFPSPLSAEDESLMPQFAALWLSMRDPFPAARRLFPNPDDVGKALYAASYWTLNPSVIAQRDAILKENPAAGLPDKMTLAKAFWDTAENDEVPWKERNVARKAYAEIMGFLQQEDIKSGVGGELPEQPIYRIVTK